MKTLQIFLIGIIILFFCGTNGFAFRCGAGLVSSGDTKARVKIICGQPTAKEKVCEGQQTYPLADKNTKTKKSKKCGDKVEVWYYNCGDNDYIYALTFEDGILKKEDTEGHGKGKSECLGK